MFSACAPAMTAAPVSRRRRLTGLAEDGSDAGMGDTSGLLRLRLLRCFLWTGLIPPQCG
jgi:hypothetical protein